MCRFVYVCFVVERRGGDACMCDEFLKRVAAAEWCYQFTSQATVATRKVALVGRQCQVIIPRMVGAVCVHKRDASTTQLTDYKRGRGGRASFSGIVATVFGATGFLGRYVVGKLGRMGSQVIIPYRCDAYEIARLKLAGDLGQMLFYPYHLRDEDALRKVMQHSNVVINLLGRDWETKNFKYNDIHVEASRNIARIARECGVDKLIHFSSLNAAEWPQPIYINGGSRFLKSKFYGELAVREEFPEAIIFRPADIYGAEDRFLRYYANFWRRAHGTVPLWKMGEATIKQPVFVSDVAKGVMQAIRNPEAIGQTYEAVGPSRYYLADLVDYFYQCMRYWNVRRWPITPLFQAKVVLMSMALNDPIYTMEKIEKDHVTDVLTGCPTLEDLGVQLTRLEDRAPFELKPYRQNAYYAERIGEFADPAPPQPV